MDRNELQFWLADGRSFAWIGRHVGLSASTVSYWARKHGLHADTQEVHAARGRLEREVLEELVTAGLSIRQICAAVDRSPATVRHWLRTYGLTTRRSRSPYVNDGQVVLGRCPRHGDAEFAVRADGGHRCLQCRSASVSDRRRRLKALMVEESGGCCTLCGYDRSIAALQFHHRDPATKSFSVAERGFTRSLARVREEVRKCVLLCANCHAEVEAGLAKLPAATVE